MRVSAQNQIALTNELMQSFWFMLNNNSRILAVKSAFSHNAWHTFFNFVSPADNIKFVFKADSLIFKNYNAGTFEIRFGINTGFSFVITFGIINSVS